MKRDVQLYLRDMWESMMLLEDYIAGLSRDTFMSDRQLQDSVIRRLEVIGEAARNVDDEYRRNHPAIPWREIAGFRDVLIHGYFGVKLDRVWDVVKKDLPELKKNLEPLLSD